MDNFIFIHKVIHIIPNKAVYLLAICGYISLQARFNLYIVRIPSFVGNVIRNQAFPLRGLSFQTFTIKVS